MSVAQLGIEVRSEQARAAAADLEKLSASSARAEAAVRTLGTGTERVSTQIRSLVAGAEAETRALAMATSAANSNTRAMEANAQASRLAAAQRANLIFQLNDVGVSLASGMSPLMVAIQQGSQIATIYGPGGLGKALAETGRMAAAMAVRFAPLVAVVGAAYSAYKLLQQYSAEAAVAVDSATAVLAAQAAPLSEVKSGISELVSLQGKYQDAINATWRTQDAATAGIIAATEREFNAKKSLLEIEVRRQEAAIQAQRAEMAAAAIQLQREVGQQVFTRADLERQGFADPRINGGVPFVRLPGDITGLEKTRDVLEKSPLNDKIKELRANLELTEIGAQKLRDALKAAFNDGTLLPGGANSGTVASDPIPIPHFRGIDDIPLDIEVYNELIKSGNARLVQMQQEQAGLGLLGAAAQAYRFEMDAINAAAAKNVELNPDQIAGIRALAEAYGKMADEAARAKLGADLAFERSQQFLSPQEQAIAARFRGTGIGMNSPEAQAMRDMNQFADAKDLAEGFLTDFKSELMRNGGDVGKALGESILNALTASMDKQLANIFDRLATAFASVMTGQQPGASAIGAASSGKVGGFASMLGIGANDNYAPGAVTSAPVTAVGSMSAYRDAIKSIESAGSGGYSALGPVLKNGNQALGAYQVMQSNLPSWTQEAFGTPMSRSQFLGNPAAQDAVFDQQFGKSLAKYGNPQDAASVWFTGRPLAAGAGASDVLGTTGSAYVNKFNAALAKASDGLGGFDNTVTNAIKTIGGTDGGGLASTLDGLKPGNFQANTSLSAILGYGGAAAPAPAAGGVGGFLSMLLGFLPNLFGFADGTENAPAGWAWVGERGPELRKLRSGDVIRSHGRSMDMVANGNAGGGGQGRQPGKVDLHVHIAGANGDEHVRMLARQGAQQAIGEYHEAQSRGGFGELQRQYASQKG
ncbi:MAG: hypothetical protein EOS43_22490 [Mesorhizobium sp.]|nr:MAG: hypothetical protein EOS43_22490 [Mesorhizobium sp.]